MSLRSGWLSSRNIFENLLCEDSCYGRVKVGSDLKKLMSISKYKERKLTVQESGSET